MGSIIWILIALVQLAVNYLIWPLMQLYGWYLIYSSGLFVINILVKLRYEVYNEDLKYKPKECKNKVLVITGATSGIGLAAAKCFLSRGFIVVACYYSKEEPGYRELEDEINKGNGERLFLVALNVKSLDSIERCYQQVQDILNSNSQFKFHALVNVAGVGFMNRFQWQSRDKIRTTLETNLYGPIMMTREFMPLLVKNAPHSRLVNVSSPLGLLATPYNTVYGATKAGLTHFTNTLRIDAIRYKVKTVNILPGNFIRNTSILNSSYTSDHKTLMATLTNEEKRLYEKDLKDHESLRVQMERVKDRPVNLSLDLEAKLSKNLKKLWLIFGGATSDQKLEDSHLMNAFDNAIRVRDPPKEMYAGNQCFEILGGACFELLCHAFLRDWTYFLANHNVNSI